MVSLFKFDWTQMVVDEAQDATPQVSLLNTKV